MSSALSRKSRDRSRASFNQPRRLSLFAHPSNTEGDDLEDQRNDSTHWASSLARSALLNQTVATKPLAKLPLSNSAWRPGLTLPGVRASKETTGTARDGTVRALDGNSVKDISPGEHTFLPVANSLAFPTRESVSSHCEDNSDVGSVSVHDTSMSSSAITLSTSLSTSSFKRAKRSLKMRVAVTLSGIFVSKPKSGRNEGPPGALDGLDGIYCERELAVSATKKGRFLKGVLSRGRKKTMDADSEGQEIQYSYISRSPSPPSPEIRPPSGLGMINPNADLSDVGRRMGFRGEQGGNYSFTGSATDLRFGSAAGQSQFDESKLSPTRAMFPSRPLTSPDTALFARESQTPTPTPSHATSACSSPVTNRHSLDSLSDIFYSPPPQSSPLAKNLPPRSASLPQPNPPRLVTSKSNPTLNSSMFGKPLPLIPVGTLDILFPPSPALSPPLSKSVAARVLSRNSVFTVACLQLILPYSQRSSLAALACVSRSFCRAVRPVLYADISFDQLYPDLRKRCLFTLASKREIAKLVISFSWNALATLEDNDTDEEEYTLSDEEDEFAGDANPDILARAISNLVTLKSLTLILSTSTHRLLSRVRSQLTSLSSTGLYSTACALFLSTWLPSQPFLTHVSLPDVFCFPLASAPSSSLSLSTSSSLSSRSSPSTSPAPRILPCLRSFSGTTSLASTLVPDRPVSCVELHISQTIYDGLRPNEVMRSLMQSKVQVTELRLRVTGKVDARTIGKVVSSAGTQLGTGIKVLGIIGWEGETKELYAQLTPSFSLFGALESVEFSTQEKHTESTDQPIVDSIEDPDVTTPTILTKFSLISNALTASANSSASSLLSDSSSPRSSIASSLDLDLKDLKFAFEFPLPPSSSGPPPVFAESDEFDSFSRTPRRISPYSVANALADLDAELNSPAAAEERRKRVESELKRKEMELELESNLAIQWPQRCPTLRRIDWSSGHIWAAPIPVQEFAY